MQLHSNNQWHQQQQSSKYPQYESLNINRLVLQSNKYWKAERRFFDDNNDADVHVHNDTMNENINNTTRLLDATINSQFLCESRNNNRSFLQGGGAGVSYCSDMQEEEAEDQEAPLKVNLIHDTQLHRVIGNARQKCQQQRQYNLKSKRKPKQDEEVDDEDDNNCDECIVGNEEAKCKDQQLSSYPHRQLKAQQKNSEVTRDSVQRQKEIPTRTVPIAPQSILTNNTIKDHNNTIYQSNKLNSNNNTTSIIKPPSNGLEFPKKQQHSIQQQQFQFPGNFSLDLSKQSLVELPKELLLNSSCRNTLQMLYLNDNHLKTFPVEIFLIKTLRVVDLSSNYLNVFSTFPKDNSNEQQQDFYLCISLQTINLSDNFLTQFNPNQQLIHSLKYLNVSRNRLSNLEDIGKLSNLVSLDISNNEFRVLPSKLSDLPLQQLTLDWLEYTQPSLDMNQQGNQGKVIISRLQRLISQGKNTFAEIVKEMSRSKGISDDMLSRRDSENKTLAHFAAVKEQIGCLISILESDFSLIDALDNQGHTPLSLSIYSSALYSAKTLIANGARLDLGGGGRGNNIGKQISEDEKVKNSYDRSSTCLHLAIQQAQPYLVGDILKYSYGMDYFSSCSYSHQFNDNLEHPMHTAMKLFSSHPHQAKMIISMIIEFYKKHAGFEINLKNSEGWTLSHLAMLHRDSNDTALKWVIEYNQQGANSRQNSQNYDYIDLDEIGGSAEETALHLACKSKAYAAVSLLIRQSVDVLTRDGNGNVPIQLCMRDNYLFKILKLAEVQQLNRFKIAEIKNEVQVREWQQQQYEKIEVENNGKKCNHFQNNQVELNRDNEKQNSNGNIELLLFTEEEEEEYEEEGDDIANEVEEGFRSYKAVNIECKSNKRLSREFRTNNSGSFSSSNNRNYAGDQNSKNNNHNNLIITMLDPLSEDIQEEPYTCGTTAPHELLTTLRSLNLEEISNSCEKFLNEDQLKLLSTAGDKQEYIDTREREANHGIILMKQSNLTQLNMMISLNNPLNFREQYNSKVIKSNTNEIVRNDEQKQHRQMQLAMKQMDSLLSKLKSSVTGADIREYARQHNEILTQLQVKILELQGIQLQSQLMQIKKLVVNSLMQEISDQLQTFPVSEILRYLQIDQNFQAPTKQIFLNPPGLNNGSDTLQDNHQLDRLVPFERTLVFIGSLQMMMLLKNNEDNIKEIEFGYQDKLEKIVLNTSTMLILAYEAANGAIISKRLNKQMVFKEKNGQAINQRRHMSSGFQDFNRTKNGIFNDSSCIQSNNGSKKKITQIINNGQCSQGTTTTTIITQGRIQNNLGQQINISKNQDKLGKNIELNISENDSKRRTSSFQQIDQQKACVQSIKATVIQPIDKSLRNGNYKGLLVKSPSVAGFNNTGQALGRNWKDIVAVKTTTVINNNSKGDIVHDKVRQRQFIFPQQQQMQQQKQQQSQQQQYQYSQSRRCSQQYQYNKVFIPVIDDVSSKENKFLDANQYANGGSEQIRNNSSQNNNNHRNIKIIQNIDFNFQQSSTYGINNTFQSKLQQ